MPGRTILLIVITLPFSCHYYGQQIGKTPPTILSDHRPPPLYAAHLCMLGYSSRYKLHELMTYAIDYK